jgi:hypothetical protein
MLIDSRYKQHDGKVFVSYADAKKWVNELMEDEWYCDKAVIGMCCFEPHSREELITMVETIGFKNDKKHTAQLELFRDYKLHPMRQ